MWASIASSDRCMCGVIEYVQLKIYSAGKRRSLLASSISDLRSLGSVANMVRL